MASGIVSSHGAARAPSCKHLKQAKGRSAAHVNIVTQDEQAFPEVDRSRNVTIATRRAPWIMIRTPGAVRPKRTAAATNGGLNHSRSGDVLTTTIRCPTRRVDERRRGHRDRDG